MGSDLVEVGGFNVWLRCLREMRGGRERPPLDYCFTAGWNVEITVLY